MKRIGVLVAFMALAPGIWAQPSFTIEKYSVKPGKKANNYNNESGRQFKKGNYNMATLNATHALRLATKKGQIREAQSRLLDSYDRAVQENLSTIESLKAASATFVNDQTITDRAKIVSLYQVMVDYNRVLNSLPSSAFDPVKKKDPKLNLDIKDFTADLQAAIASLEAGKKEAAAWHYQQGRDLARSSELEANKQAARHFRWAMDYVPGYEDARKWYDKTRKLGTTRMGIMRFETSAQPAQYGDLGAMVSDEFIAKMPKDYEFFELVTRDQLDVIIREQRLNISGLMDETSTAEVGQLKGVNVLLVGKVTSASQDRQQGGGDQVYKEEKEIADGKEKYIDAEGNEKTRTKYKTVTAYVRFYHKSASGNVTGSFKVLDVKTGTIVKAGAIVGNYEWKHRWATFTGDERALSSSTRSLVNNGPGEFPSRNKMVINAAEDLAHNLIEEVKKYAGEVGQ